LQFWKVDMDVNSEIVSTYVFFLSLFSLFCSINTCTTVPIYACHISATLFFWNASVWWVHCRLYTAHTHTQNLFRLQHQTLHIGQGHVPSQRRVQSLDAQGFMSVHCTVCGQIYRYVCISTQACFIQSRSVIHLYSRSSLGVTGHPTGRFRSAELHVCCMDLLFVCMHTTCHGVQCLVLESNF